MRRAGDLFFCRMRFESSLLARWSSARRERLRFLPARLMKKLSMRMPDCGPLGETFFEARDLAIAAASFLNRPGGGKVETVFTPATHLLLGRLFGRLGLCRLRFVEGMTTSGQVLDR